MIVTKRLFWRRAEGDCQHCGQADCALNLTTYGDGRAPNVDAECRTCGGANGWMIPEQPDEHWHEIKVMDLRSGAEAHFVPVCRDADATLCRVLLAAD